MNHLYRCSLPGWAVVQQQEYYSAMARRGLLIDKYGTWLTRFSKGTPSNLIYRLDAAHRRNSEPEEAQRQFYESCGWKFVCKADYFHLYCAPETAVELHTDPQWQTQTLVPVKKSLRSELLWTALEVIFWCLLAWFNFFVMRGFHDDLTAAETVALFFAQCGFVLPLLLLLLIILKVNHAAIALYGFSRYLRQIRSENVRSPSLKRFLILQHSMSAVYIGVFLALGMTLFCLMPRSVPLGQEPDGQYLLHLEQLEPDVTIFQGRSKLGVESGQTDVINIPIASLQLDNTQLSDGDGNSPWLFQHYLRLSGPLDPSLVTQAMSKYWSLGTLTPIEVSGLDYALIDDSRHGMVELCVCKGRRILFVQYLGYQASAQEVLNLAQQILTTA